MSLVSYVVPCFNCENYILACLASILNQKSVEIEVIVVNDGSTDRSLDLIREFMTTISPNKVKVYSHHNGENRGVSASRILGVKKARGDYIAFLDADDVLISPTKTIQQLSVMSANPNIVLVHSGVSIIGDMPSDAADHERHFSQRSKISPYSLFNVDSSLEVNCIANSSVLVKKSCLANFSFNQLFQVEDFVLWHLVACHGDFYCIPDGLVGYRYHSASASCVYNKSALTRLYASIEFKLALVCKSPSRIQALAAIFSVASDLSGLVAYYNKNGEIKTNSLTRVFIILLAWTSTALSGLARILYRAKGVWR